MYNLPIMTFGDASQASLENLLAGIDRNPLFDKIEKVVCQISVD